MKIQVLSDLHLEFGNMYFVPAEDADVLVLAGDIGTMKNAKYLDLVEEWAENFEAVIYVAGNHEFYKTDIEKSIAHLREWSNQHENIFFLENDLKVINDVHFLGATMWSDFNAHPLAAFHCQSNVNDFHTIRTQLYERPFTPQDAQLKYDASVAFIKQGMRISYIYPVVVVTHHAPSFRSVPREFEGSLLNYAFASDLESLIETYEPTLWIHGHMHNSVDYMIEKTRVVCNPRGYVGYELNDNFDKVKVIEV